MRFVESKNFHRSEKDTTLFTAEVSAVGSPGGRFILETDQGNIEFEYQRTDRDASNEDILGWHFTEVSPSKNKHRVLIIND